MLDYKGELSNAKILVTGGTGSFGRAFIKKIFETEKTASVIIYSRDEYKQFLLRQEYNDLYLKRRIKFVIGDVRDMQRLYTACKGVDYIVHAAAQKQVPSCEENMEEAIKTNVMGAMNIKNIALERDIKKVIALSTDKAVMPVNLYGATKMLSDKLLVDTENDYNTKFAIVRYGNVANSRGSVIQVFKDIRDRGGHVYPVTDKRMTRFWIDLKKAVELAMIALLDSKGGETYVAKLPSFRITDMVLSFEPDAEISEIGIRPGEKLHEMMITEYDARKTVKREDYFVIYPSEKQAIESGETLVNENFTYESDKNNEWLNVENLREMIDGILK